MIATDRERRTEMRLSFTRPCKVLDPRGNRFIAGTTSNASRHGLLVYLHKSLPCQAGDRLFISIPTRRNRGMLKAAEMVEVEVVRCLSSTSGETALALHAGQPLTELELPLPLAA